jgi:hypothetical protein
MIGPAIDALENGADVVSFFDSVKTAMESDPTKALDTIAAGVGIAAVLLVRVPVVGRPFL